MNTDENAPFPGQPQQQTPFVEQPGKPNWNNQPEQPAVGLPASEAPIGQNQSLPPQGYYSFPGANQGGTIGEPTLPSQVGSPNSVPLYGTFDPTTGQFTPSQPINAYVTPPSHPMYAPPSQPMYAPAPHWDRASSTVAQQSPVAAKRKRVSRRLIAMAATVLVILAVAGGGLAYVSMQNKAASLAASKAADALCAHLVAKDYGSVYGGLTNDAQSQDTSSQFGRLFTTLDQLEGSVTSCHQAAGAYSYKSGSSTATTTLSISRATLGVLTGPLTLQKEGGVWKTSNLVTALLGVSPSALTATDSFCSAMQSQQYSNLDTFLGSGEAVQMTATDFEVNSRLQDLFDGPVSDCKVTQIGTGNTDSTTTMTLSIARTKTQPQSGHITLAGSGSIWTLSSADAGILGTDYRPVIVGEDFCTDVQNNDLGSAYKLFDSSFQQTYSLASIESELNESGWSYLCGDPDMSTFTSSGGTASYQLDFGAQGRDYYHTSGTFRMTLYFAEQSGTWYLDGYKYVNK